MGRLLAMTIGLFKKDASLSFVRLMRGGEFLAVRLFFSELASPGLMLW